MSEETKYTGLEVAVIGMAGRFPGAKNIAEFWDNLKLGMETLCFFSDRELLEEGVEPEQFRNETYVRSHGFLEDNDYFDYSFFDYTPREAAVMDPQIRIFHECVWTALEDAAYDPLSYPGLIGLYAGASPSFKWEAIALLSGQTGDMGAFAASQLVDKDFLCVRVSHKLNLKGPSITLYSACSTSLAAIHLAIQAVLNGECGLALGGGVTVLQFKKAGYTFHEGMVGSPDGHCRPFDRQSAGTVAANGVGVVVLKRLEEALSDRDHIYAVVKGSALNNDGRRRAGFTAPSVEGQAEVIRIAQMTAELKPENIGFIEAHGTATALGDPVEIEGLKLAFNTVERGSCAVGTVKSNMGHLDSAAGVTGFIKTVLALRERQIPPSLHFKSPNPGIDFDNSPFYINDQLQQRNDDSAPLRAGVSSFGLGGTNAHVILEEPPRIPPPEDRPVRPFQMVMLSARTKGGLERLSVNLADYFRRHPGTSLADAAYTLQVGRAHFKYRRLLVCAEREELATALASGHSPALRDRLVRDKDRPVVFMFSGQGSQYVNMGLELYQVEKSFRQEMDRCFDILERRWNYPVREILYPAGEGEASAAGVREKIDHVLYSGPVKFSFEYALATLLMKWGIRPQALIGHSFGEYTAAALSGVFSLEDALELVVLRGQLMEQTEDGAMMSVSLGEEALTPFLNEKLWLAAVNSPDLSIVSGARDAVDELDSLLTGRGHECIRVNFPRASHSGLMKPVAGLFEKRVAAVKRRKPQIPYISGLSGRWISEGEAVDPAYWSAHLVRPIRFGDGITTLLERLDPVFVQPGSDRGLPLFVRQHPQTEDRHPALNMVRHPKEEVSDEAHLLNQLGTLWLWGSRLNWAGFHESDPRRRLSLPAYSFERHRFPLEKDLPDLAADMMSAGNLQTKRPHRADWFYVPSWTRTGPTLSPPPPRDDRDSWLVFLDECGLGERLAERLRQGGRGVITVRVGEAFVRRGDREFIIRPGEKKDYEALLDDLMRRDNPNLRVAHLWTVTHMTEEDGALPAPARGEAILTRGLYSLFYLVREWGKRRGKQSLSIQVVSNRMQDVVGGELSYPEKATLLGAVKAVPLEYPEVKCRSIDIIWPLPPEEAETAVFQLGDELAGNADEPVVAFRGRHRWEQTFKPQRLEDENGGLSRLKEKGVYWITGGLGGIGMVLAEHLATRRQARLVLSGRSAFPPREVWDQWLTGHADDDPTALKIKKLLELEDRGADILTVQADAADRRQMRRVMEMTLERFGTLDGVVHCAGVADGALMARRDRQSIAAILAPKFQGTLILDELLRETAAEFLILCSSVNAILPALGQLGHTAANAFMDAFSWYKHSRRSGNSKKGPAVISVNWNAWREVGQAVESIRKSIERNRDVDMNELDALGNDEGISLFNRVMGENLPQVVVSTVDFNRRLERSQAPLSHGVPVFPEESDSETEQPDGTCPPRPDLSSPYIPPSDPLEQALVDIWQQRFGFRKIGIRDNFFELGGDSVKGMMFVNRYKKLLGEIVHVTVVFNAPTIEELAGYFSEHYPEAAARIRGDEKVSPNREKDNVTRLDEETVAQFRRSLPRFSPPVETAAPKNPPAIFILSASRSGSTLLRVILAGHPRLFAPPELALLSARNLGENRGTREGCIRALMELKDCGVHEAGALMAVYEDRQMGVRQFYRLLQEWLGDRTLVDKTPGYAMDLDVLRQAENYFRDPLYIHLVRHPLGMIRSFEEAKLDLFFSRDLLKRLSKSRRELAELSWIVSNQNIREFFKEIPPQRQHRLRFEDLVHRPNEEIEKICRFLGCPFHPDMLNPYQEKKRRMTDGIHAGGIMLGDVKFHQHLRIDPAVADTWKEEYPEDFLGDVTWKMAEELGYRRQAAFPPLPDDPLRPVEQREYYALAPAQQRLYVTQQLEESHVAYNMFRMIPMTDVDRDRLVRTFTRLIDRHESLRTSFHLVGGEPVQRVHRQVDLTNECYELEAAAGSHEKSPQNRRRPSLDDILKDFIRPFDLALPPLLRIGLVKEAGEGQYVLLVDMHHIISDRVSHAVLVEEFRSLYGGGRPAELKLQYKDYAVWQNHGRQQEELIRQENYWLKVFSGDLPPLRLPLDYPRPPIRSFAGATLRFNVGIENTAALKALALKEGVTLQILMLSIFYILLFKFSDQTDIVVGTSVNGRRHADLEKIIGVFVNVLALRNFPGREKRFVDFLGEVRQNSLLAYDNQDYQFEELVKRVWSGCKNRDPGRHPLFDVMFEMMKAAEEIDSTAAATDPDSLRYDSAASKFDLDWMGIETGKDIFFTATYSTQIFKAETVRLMIDFFRMLIDGVVENRESEIGRLLTGPEEVEIQQLEKLDFNF